MVYHNEYLMVSVVRNMWRVRTFTMEWNIISRKLLESDNPNILQNRTHIPIVSPHPSRSLLRPISQLALNSLSSRINIQ